MGAVQPSRSILPAITEIRQVKTLTTEEAKKAYPVRIQAIVTYYDHANLLCFAQDGSGGIYLSTTTEDHTVRAGQIFEISGTTAVKDAVPIIEANQFRLVQTGQVPPARLVSVIDLQKPELNSEWVEVHGTIRAVLEEEGRLSYVVLAENQRFKVIVHTLARGRDLSVIGQKISARGVCISFSGPGEEHEVRIYCASSDYVEVERGQGGSSGVTNYNSILQLQQAKIGTRARLRLLLTEYKQGVSFKGRDQTGEIRGETLQWKPARAGAVIEAVGFVAQKGADLVLEDAVLDRVGFNPDFLHPLSIKLSGRAQIQSVLEIRRLTSEEASREFSVRLRGVITYYDPEWNVIFFQGASEGIYVDAHGQELDIKAGHLVILEGSTGPGEFAPVVRHPVFQILGHSPMPEPRIATFDELMTGSLDSQWVKTEGIIRSIKTDGNRFHFEVSPLSGEGMIDLYIPRSQARSPEELVDAQVEIEAVSGTAFNEHRELYGVDFFSPELRHVRVQAKSASDPFSTTVTPIARLFQFAPERELNHRVHVRGTVTYSTTNRLYLEDSTGGILVIPPENAAPLQVGELADIVAFPKRSKTFKALDTATFRMAGTEASVAPKQITAETGKNLESGLDGRLIVLDADFLQHTWSPTESTLLLQFGNAFFHAILEPRFRGMADELRTGSKLRLTGVCSIGRNERGESIGFRLFLRSPDDIILLAVPPWSFRHVLTVVLSLAGVIIAALGWVITLRKQVKRQTHALSEQNAALEQQVIERQRAEAELVQAHREIVEKSRLAGMAEVATGVLHNVGNVLNSVNVSSNLLVDRLKKSRVAELKQAVALLRRPAGDLASFLTNDPKGRKVPEFLALVADRFSEENQRQLDELKRLQSSIAHIRDIVTVQQCHAKHSGLIESVQIPALIEDTLRMNQELLLAYNVRVSKQIGNVAEVLTDKHKVLQVLVNLVRNASRACGESDATEKRIIIRVSHTEDEITIAVIDNGVGIPKENLTRIFTHGFTTRKDGHGFGLHTSANAARDLGGSLTARSDGPGLGARFDFTLPLRKRANGFGTTAE
jgi:signal transduction histidine kinase